MSVVATISSVNLLNKLKLTYLLTFLEIEPWTFEQHIGEAVMIPAGCPYQIRNLKVMSVELVDVLLASLHACLIKFSDCCLSFLKTYSIVFRLKPDQIGYVYLISLDHSLFFLFICSPV